MAGTFVSASSLRGLLWGIDGIALIVATALLAVHHARRDNDVMAAGFLVFLAGETLILASTAMEPVTGVPVFGAGVGLWAASMTLTSVPRLMPTWLRVVAVVGAVLFGIVAVQIFTGHTVTPLSRPLPFFGYPFLAATLLGWAWRHYRDAS